MSDLHSYKNFNRTQSSWPNRSSRQSTEHSATTTTAPAPASASVAPLESFIEIRFSITCLFLVLFLALFVATYAQLLLARCSRQKRLSYQTVFLFLCLAWAALRAQLFSFFLHDRFSFHLLDDSLKLPLYLLLYALPPVLQYSIFALFIIYFAAVRLSSLS